jgi:integrase
MGLRAGEIFNLTWADINLGNGTVFIKDTKTGHNRHAYMTDKVRAEIESMERGQGKDLVFPAREYAKIKHMASISKTFMRSVADLKLNEGIEDPRHKIVFHSMRHTFASWLVQKGVSIYVVKELLGHRTLTMTERYSHVAADHLRQAAAILDGQSNVIPFPKQEVGNQ